MNVLNNSMTRTLTFCLMGALSFGLYAKPLDETIRSQQQLWAQANYQLSDDAQEEAFKRLILEAEKAVAKFPKSAEVWAWRGIIKSSFAAVEGGLGALSLAEAAKEDFEKALALDSNVLEGATYASLGILYHKVPGWPVGFGSDDKANELFQKSMKVNPAGRESNFFYGEFLYNEGKYVQAKNHLLTAKNVPEAQWKDRPVAYKHRQEQIDAMLAKVDKRLNRRKRR